MGILDTGILLSWVETKQYADHVRRHGINQFINLFHKVKNNKYPNFKWGDETEYMLIRLDHSSKKALLNLQNDKILKILQKKMRDCPECCGEKGCIWSPEASSHMLESSPGTPFCGNFSEFNLVEKNMALRRKQVLMALNQENGDTCLTLTSFPRIGCPNYCIPSSVVHPMETKLTQSLFMPDESVSPWSRYIALERNIRLRRGENVAINIPVFKDIYTKSPFWEQFENDVDGKVAKNAKKDHIYVDSTAFGLGFACLQITIQAFDFDEAKLLHDQLVPLCPILIALSASSPIVRGLLSDYDSRWSVLSTGSDCRTKEERGDQPLKNDRFVIPKSRFGWINCYLSSTYSHFNDIYFPYDEEFYEQMKAKGVDDQFAAYMAHIFVRDPIYCVREKLHQSDEKDTGHFENMMSTNYPAVKFKLPHDELGAGWRVEFRPMDVQLTEFENAAYAIFLVLLTRTILTLKLNFVIPISKVDDNMESAQMRDAVIDQKFHFKMDPWKSQTVSNDCNESNHGICEMNINTIINGGITEDGTKFLGLIPLIHRYISDLEDTDLETRRTVTRYLKLISDRAAGRVKTTARWIRDFVDGHTDYKHDSVVTEQINYDLIKLCADISEEKVMSPFTPRQK